MKEIAAGEITLGHIGCRVVVIDTTGNAYAGVLTDVSAIAWKYGERPEDKVRIRIKVKSEEDSELCLDRLPLDFRLQVESQYLSKDDVRVVKAKDLLP